MSSGEVTTVFIIHVGVTNFPSIPCFFGGAIQRRIWELARTQAVSGDEVAIVSIGKAGETKTIEGIRIVYIRCLMAGPLRHLEFLGRAALAIRRISRGRRHVVVHFHSQPEGALFRAVFRTPAVLSYDFFRFRRGRKGLVGVIIRYCLLRFDHLLPCSEYCKKESTDYWDLPAGRVSVLYNGVNTDQFRPLGRGRAAELSAISSASCIALYVGRIARQKGSEILIAAAERLAARRIPVAVVAAGPIGQFDADGDNGDWIGRMRRAGITYLGAIREDRLAAIYCSADVFVMPTIELEMFGMAALEALACGVPVIATDHGGLPEVITVDCGVFVPVSDAIALASAVERLVLDPGERAQLAAAAVERAEVFSWNAIARRARTHYAAALGESARNGSE